MLLGLMPALVRKCAHIRLRPHAVWVTPQDELDPITLMQNVMFGGQGKAWLKKPSNAKSPWKRMDGSTPLHPGT